MKKKRTITVFEIICDYCKKNRGYLCSYQTVTMNDGTEFHFCDHRCSEKMWREIELPVTPKSS